jgi:hypothetical protein
VRRVAAAGRLVPFLPRPFRRLRPRPHGLCVRRAVVELQSQGLAPARQKQCELVS